MTQKLKNWEAQTFWRRASRGKGVPVGKAACFAPCLRFQRRAQTCPVDDEQGMASRIDAAPKRRRHLPDETEKCAAEHPRNAGVVPLAMDACTDKARPDLWTYCGRHPVVISRLPSGLAGAAACTDACFQTNFGMRVLVPILGTWAHAKHCVTFRRLPELGLVLVPKTRTSIFCFFLPAARKPWPRNKKSLGNRARQDESRAHGICTFTCSGVPFRCGPAPDPKRYVFSGTQGP